MSGPLPDPARDDDALLGPGDPPPFERLNEDGKAPVLLICDHASKRVPAALDRLGLDKATLALHVGWDIGAAEVARRMSARLDAMAVLAGYSRLVIDPNRQPGDPTSIPEESHGIAVPGNKGLSEAEQIARANEIHRPYHDAVADGLAHLWRSGTPPALFSVHSFTPTLGGEDRYWHAGVLWNRDPRLAERLIARLAESDPSLHIGDNQPYSGKELAYSLDLHAGAAGLPNCAIEIRQDQVADDAGAERWAALLAGALSDILAEPGLHRVAHF